MPKQRSIFRVGREGFVWQSSVILRLAVLGVMFCAMNGALCAQGNFGFGMVFGDPTGISWKAGAGSLHAIAGAIGFSPSDRLRLHADYLWFARPFRDDQFAVYFGPGVAAGFGRPEFPRQDDGASDDLHRDHLGVGLRGVAGLAWVLPQTPVEMYVECAPMVIVSPETGFGLDAGLGLRIYP